MLVNLLFYIYILGEYFFELDHRSVVPGYPKLIKDVWGIVGPIDAAFTRFNCQGKTYVFKVGTPAMIFTNTRFTGISLECLNVSKPQLGKQVLEV